MLQIQCTLLSALWASDTPCSAHCNLNTDIDRSVQYTPAKDSPGSTQFFVSSYTDRSVQCTLTIDTVQSS